MHLDQPRNRLGLGRRKAEARAEGARNARSRNGMVLDAALGDVMQKERDVEQLTMAWLNGAHELVGEGGVVAAARLDIGKCADAAQEMLVDGVVMIHIELHHGDDAPEGGNEAPE